MAIGSIPALGVGRVGVRNVARKWKKGSTPKQCVSGCFASGLSRLDFGADQAAHQRSAIRALSICQRFPTVSGVAMRLFTACT